MSKKYAVSNFGGRDLWDSFFDDFFDFPYFSTRPIVRDQTMKADVSDEGDHYLVQLDLPSIEKKDVKISLTDGYLTISAQTGSHNEEQDAKGRYLRRERFYGTYSRSFYVGDELTEKDIQAKLENGVLSLKVAKKEEVKPAKKYIDIA